MHQRGKISGLLLSGSLDQKEFVLNGCSCPLCGKGMRNPVMTADGDSFDKACIAAWLEDGNSTNPITGQILPNLHLIPNYNLQALLEMSIDLPSTEKLARIWANSELATQLHYPGSPTSYTIPTPSADKKTFSLTAAPISQPRSGIPRDEKTQRPVNKDSSVSVAALFKQGLSHYRLHQDRQALTLFLQAASLADAPCTVFLLLGRIFSRQRGCGVPLDMEKAKLCDLLAATHTDKLKQRAAQGEVDALYYLGMCHYYGVGMPQNQHEAVHQFVLAAVRGQADAQYQLALCYQQGYGGEKNLPGAFFWYQQLSRIKFAPAYFQLADCYEYGEGVTKNLHEAVHQYYQAAEKGHVLAQYYLAWCFEKGEGIPKNLLKAVEWYTLAGDQGCIDAQYRLAMCYRLGNGVVRDMHQALYWLGLAAAQGDASSQYTLGCCYQHEEEVLNGELAIYWYQRAADQGYAQAQFTLGWCYKTGTAVTQDVSLAAQYFKQAAAQGYALAEFYLAKCYADGEGVARNPLKAIALYQSVLAKDYKYADLHSPAQLALQSIVLSHPELNRLLDFPDAMPIEEQKEKKSTGFEAEITSGLGREIAEGALCSITGALMVDPVATPEGHSFEKEALENWLKYNSISPMTRTALSVDILIPNRSLKKAIDDFNTGCAVSKAIKKQDFLLKDLAHYPSQLQPDLEKKPLPPKAISMLPSTLAMPGGSGKFAPRHVEIKQENLIKSNPHSSPASSQPEANKDLGSTH